MGIKSSLENKKGFTIIEVVLVLAIAGLIFLMVFLAWPALQRNQKDTQRKEDMARFLTSLNNYQSNNNGKVPENWGDFIKNYLQTNGDTFEDPNGTAYYVADRGKVTGAESVSYKCSEGTCDGEIQLYHSATCDGEQVKASKGGERKIAFMYKLEGAGVYCGSN